MFFSVCFVCLSSAAAKHFLPPLTERSAVHAATLQAKQESVELK